MTGVQDEEDEKEAAAEKERFEAIKAKVLRSCFQSLPLSQCVTCACKQT